MFVVTKHNVMFNQTQNFIYLLLSILLIHAEGNERMLHKHSKRKVNNLIYSNIIKLWAGRGINRVFGQVCLALKVKGVLWIQYKLFLVIMNFTVHRTALISNLSQPPATESALDLGRRPRFCTGNTILSETVYNSSHSSRVTSKL